MASRAIWAGLLGAAILAGGLAGCGGRDDHSDHSANTQAEAAKEPAPNAVAPVPANTVDAAEAERRAQAAATTRRASLAAQMDALTTAPAPYEGDSTAATSLPPPTDDAPPAPSQPNTTGPHG